MSFLTLEGIHKSYGETPVINGVSLAAEKGEFVVFVGPSGCGKSTLLRMIAGLEDVTTGEVCIDGADVTYIDPAKREVAMVFQSYALYPHMSVYENMAFGLRMAKLPKPEIEARIKEAARILRIESLLERKPRALSGGQRQRVAIGRAIVRKPKLFLFDEPLSNLDAELRTQMRVEIARLHRDLGATMVYVTHDQVEAMTLADRIVVLRGGIVEQIGRPTHLYDDPANTFVAGFIGSPKMNFLTASVETVEGSEIVLSHPSFVDGRLRVRPRHGRAVPVGARVQVGLRPEHLAVSGERPVLSLVVDFPETLGGSTLVYMRPDETEESFVVLAQGRPPLAPDERVTLSVAPEHVYLFDEDGKAL